MQAKVGAKFSEPLCQLYRKFKGRPEKDWETGTVSYDDFLDFCQNVSVVPDMVSPFELQVFFQDHADEDTETLAESQFAECVIQCIRDSAGDWTQASKHLDDICKAAMM